MASPIDLTTPANALDWLQIGSPSSAQSALISRLITATSTQIQKFLGYNVLAADFAKTFDGPGGKLLSLPDGPIISVASVQVGAVSIGPGTLTGVGYFIGDSVIELCGYEFCRGRGNVAVSYRAGYEAVPADIEQACLDWLSGAWNSQDRDPTLAKIKAGDTEFDYGSATTKVGLSTLLMPPSVASVLQPYRRVF